MAIRHDFWGNPEVPYAVDKSKRQRVSQLKQLFDDRTIYAINDNSAGMHQWIYIASGGTATYNGSDSTVDLVTNTTSGSKVIRQTRRYLTYIPGNTNLLQMTCIPDASNQAVRQRIGQYDDNNGIYWIIDSGENLGIGIRSDATGTVVDSITYSSSFNADRLNGSGGVGNESNAKYVNSASHLFTIDYQWLGTGDVSFYTLLGGQLVNAHTTNISNQSINVFMRTATLPLRYEIENLATLTTTPKLKSICAMLATEGSADTVQANFVAGNGTTLVTRIVRQPIFALRLLNTFNSRNNRVIAEFLGIEYFSNTAPTFYEVVHVFDVGSLYGATFTQVSTNISACEKSTDIASLTGGNQHIISQSYIAAGGQGSGQYNSAGGDYSDVSQEPFHFLSQNYGSTKSDLFVVFATSITGVAAGTTCGMSWREVH